MSERARGYAHRIDVAAATVQVWEALTDSGNLRLWCAPDARIQARPGGMFRASVDRITQLEAHIDVFEPLRRLRLIYLAAQTLPPAASVLTDDFILEPAHPGTIVRLLGAGFPASNDWEVPYLRMRKSWQQALTRLKVFVERHPQREVS